LKILFWSFIEILEYLLAKLVVIGLLFNAEVVFFGETESREVLIFKIEIVWDTFDKVETEVFVI